MTIFFNASLSPTNEGWEVFFSEQKFYNKVSSEQQKLRASLKATPR